MLENSKSFGDFGVEGEKVFMGRFKEWFSRINPFGKMSDRSIAKSYSLTNALLYGPPKLDIDSVCISLDDENEFEDDSSGMASSDDSAFMSDMEKDTHIPSELIIPEFIPGRNENAVVYGPPRREMDFRRGENRPDNE